MGYYLYILLSTDGVHCYIGSTGNLDNRIKRHNAGFSKSTKPYRPWKIIYQEVYVSRSEASKREFFLKSPKGYNEYLSIKKILLNKSGRVA